jgi:hypothetical protein
LRFNGDGATVISARLLFFGPLTRGSDHYQIWILNAIGEVVSVFEITAKLLLLRKDGLT